MSCLFPISDRPICDSGGSSSAESVSQSAVPSLNFGDIVDTLPRHDISNDSFANDFEFVSSSYSEQRSDSFQKENSRMITRSIARERTIPESLSKDAESIAKLMLSLYGLCVASGMEYQLLPEDFVVESQR
jgi:hypothetical protein